MKPSLILSLFVILTLISAPNLSVAGRTGEKCPDENTLTRQARIALVEAQKLMGEEKIKEAKITLETFVREYPEENHAYVAYTMAGIYLEQGKMEAALAQYEKTIGFCPAYAPAWQNIGKVCYDLGKYSRAATALEKTWELTGKENHALRFHAAAAYISAKAPQKALTILEFLCSGQAGAPEENWVKLLVHLSIEQKTPGSAVKTVERLLAQPDPKPYLFLLATSLYLDMNLYKKAVQNLDAYGLIKSLTRAEQILLADLYNNLGIPARAAENYEKSLALEPSQKIHERMATAWFDACEYETALAAAKQGLTTYPDSYALWKLVGWIHYEAKAFVPAAEAFHQASTLDPKDAKSLFMYGLCSCRAGDNESARKALQQAACNVNYKDRAMGLIRQMEAAAEKI
ncbi:MAG: tetratricopeptide repeat protein [Desulfobacter sp.]